MKVSLLRATGFGSALLKEALARGTRSYLSPSAQMAPGARTGKFRLGSGALLIDENGDSKTSVEDFALAMLDGKDRATFGGDSQSATDGCQRYGQHV